MELFFLLLLCISWPFLLIFAQDLSFPQWDSNNIQENDEDDAGNSGNFNINPFAFGRGRDLEDAFHFSLSDRNPRRRRLHKRWTFVRPSPPRFIPRIQFPIFQPPTILSSLPYRLLQLTNNARMAEGRPALCLNV